MEKPKSTSGGKRRKSSVRELSSGLASRMSISNSLNPSTTSNGSGGQLANGASGSNGGVPDGILPLFLTTATLKVFDIRIGENVTKDTPLSLIRKQDLLQDIQTRLSISDFQPAKQVIMDYSEDEMLLYYDFEFKYGQNFYLVSNVAAKERLLHAELEQKEQVVIQESKKGWVCLGSDIEINAEKVVPMRPQISMLLSRRRKDFGQEVNFEDANPEVNDFQFHPYVLEVPDVIKVHRSLGIQSIDAGQDRSTQTTWHRLVVSSTQYEEQMMRDDDIQEILENDATGVILQKLVENIEPLLYYNEYVDIFTDDYTQLGDEDLIVEENSSSGLLEFQSFTDTNHTKDKTVAALDWYPNQRGVIAHSCVRRMTLDEKIDVGPPITPLSSMIVIWSFHDPINPQLFLEAPDDIQCIQFNPKNPNLLAGGCINGQIVIWDITEHEKILMADKKTLMESKSLSKKASETPVVKWAISTPVESSHKGPVTDLTWLETPIEHSSLNNHESDLDGHYMQIVTCSLDGTVAFWDTRMKTTKDLRSNAKSGDALGKAFMKISLSSADNSIDYSLTKLSLRTSSVPEDPIVTSQQPASSKPKHVNILKNMTKFYCGTEEGEILYADWSSDRPSDDKSNYVEYSVNMHFGCVSDIRRSPFFPDIVISVGGWSLNIWKEESKHHLPLLRYQCTSSSLLSVCWSPTRPGVFFITRSDGKLEIWDLLDSYYEPICIQSVSSTSLASVSIIHYQGKTFSKNQYVATGDDDGTLHILEVPRNLCKPSKAEKFIMQTFFDLETKRLNYTNERKLNKQTKDALGGVAVVANDQTNTAQAGAQSGSRVGSAEGKTSVDHFEEQFNKMELEFAESLGLLPSAA